MYALCGVLAAPCLSCVLLYFPESFRGEIRRCRSARLGHVRLCTLPHGYSPCLVLLASPHFNPFQTSENFIQIVTTTHKDVTERLMQINPTLAKEARKVLDVNKSERHIRGGLATKEKYLHQHELGLQ